MHRRVAVLATLTGGCIFVGMLGNQFAVAQEGNFYIAEVDNGGVQKYAPRPGANPDYLVGPLGLVAASRSSRYHR